jgi:nucleoside-diphosphate-sugar epimerase
VQKLLIVGCGDVARRALPRLIGHYRVYSLLRDPAQCAWWRRAGAFPVLADLDRASSLQRIAGLADVVLHFAPPAARAGEKSAAAVDTRTRSLLAALSRGKSLPQRLVYISTSGVYGDCQGDRVDETRPTSPSTPRALRRVDAERQLRAFGRRNKVAVSILRAPGIYAADRLPLERLRAGTKVLCDADDVYTNHIHADDLARACCLALWRGSAQRVYNVNDDSGMKMGHYFDLAADLYGLPRPPRIAREGADQQLPLMLLSFMNESRRMVNHRMKRELRLVLQYPTVVRGLG